MVLYSSACLCELIEADFATRKTCALDIRGKWFPQRSRNLCALRYKDSGFFVRKRRFAHSVLACPPMTAAHRIMHCVLQAVFCALSFVRRGCSSIDRSRSRFIDGSAAPLRQCQRTPNSTITASQRLNPRSRFSAPYRSALHARAIDAVCGCACSRGEHVASEHLDRDRGRTAAERERAQLPLNLSPKLDIDAQDFPKVFIEDRGNFCGGKKISWRPQLAMWISISLTT